MKILFTIAFLLGMFIRILNSEVNVVRIGNILMAIAMLGGLLLYGKRMGGAHFRSEKTPLRLGIADGLDSIPIGFDAKGRTPFERVRGE
jgi:hypothetical protein